MPKFLSAAFLSVGLLLVAATAHGIVVLTEPIVIVAERATDIVEAQVLSATPRWGDVSRAWIVTDLRVLVHDAIRSSRLAPGDEATVTVWGGTIDDATWSIPGVARPKPGGRFIMFLATETGGRSYRPIGQTQGFLALVENTPREWVVREHDSSPLQRGLTTTDPPAAGFLPLGAVREALAATRYSPARTGEPQSADESLPATPAPTPPSAVVVGYWPGRVPLNPFGTWAGGWQGWDLEQVNKWNYYASVFDVQTPTGTWSPTDGIADLIGWPSSAILQQYFGYSWEPGVLGITFVYRRGVVIVEATVALNPAYSWTLDDAAIYKRTTSRISFCFTMLHELGHVFGLDHNFRSLAAMNYPPSGFSGASLPYLDDAVGLRASYPTYANTRTDLAVYLYWHGPNLMDYRDASMPSSVVAGESFSVSRFTIENVGTETVVPVVDWYLQSDLNPSSSWEYLGRTTYPSLGPGQYFNPDTISTSLRVPTSTSPGQYYLLANLRNEGGPSVTRFPWNNSLGYSRAQIRVTTSGQNPPGAPTALTAAVSGSTVTFTWAAPTTGGTPTTYVLEAGSSPGASNLANFATGNTATSYTASGLAVGTYYARVRARNNAGTSGPSNEVTVVVGCVSSAPTGLAASISGSTVRLSWNAASGATSYVIGAGSAPGASNLALIDTGSSATTFTATNVPPGSYWVRVRARSSCGLSGPSNELLVWVW